MKIAQATWERLRVRRAQPQTRAHRTWPCPRPPCCSCQSLALRGIMLASQTAAASSTCARIAPDRFVFPTSCLDCWIVSASFAYTCIYGRPASAANASAFLPKSAYRRCLGSGFLPRAPAFAPRHLRSSLAGLSCWVVRVPSPFDEWLSHPSGFLVLPAQFLPPQSNGSVHASSSHHR